MLTQKYKKAFEKKLNKIRKLISRTRLTKNDYPKDFEDNKIGDKDEDKKTTN